VHTADWTNQEIDGLLRLADHSLLWCHFRRSHRTEFRHFGNYNQYSDNWINAATPRLSG